MSRGSYKDYLGSLFERYETTNVVPKTLVFLKGPDWQPAPQHDPNVALSRLSPTGLFKRTLSLLGEPIPPFPPCSGCVGARVLRSFPDTGHNAGTISQPVGLCIYHYEFELQAKDRLVLEEIRGSEHKDSVGEGGLGRGYMAVSISWGSFSWVSS